MKVLRTLLLLLLLTPLAGSAQDEGRSKKEQEKILAKQEHQKLKDQKAAEKELRKRHLELQDKDTRKRIKRHDKRADRKGTNTHRDPCIKRIFTRKR